MRMTCRPFLGVGEWLTENIGAWRSPYSDGETGTIGPRSAMELGCDPWSGLWGLVALPLPSAHLSPCCQWQRLPPWLKLLHVDWVGGQPARLFGPFKPHSIPGKREWR